MLYEVITCGNRMNHFLIDIGHSGDNLVYRGAGQGGIVVDPIPQLIEDRRDTAGRIKVFHEIFTTGIHGRKLRSGPAEPVELFQG